MILYLSNVIISSHMIYEMVFSQKQLRFGADKHYLLPAQCHQCEFKKLCNGECPKNRIFSTNTGETELNYLCEGYYVFGNIQCHLWNLWLMNYFLKGLQPMYWIGRNKFHFQ